MSLFLFLFLLIYVACTQYELLELSHFFLTGKSLKSNNKLSKTINFINHYEIKVALSVFKLFW